MIDPSRKQPTGIRRRANPTPGFVPFDKGWIEKNVPACFEASVRARPDKLAVIDDESQYRYAALNARANQLARVLYAHEEDAGADAMGVALLCSYGVKPILGMLASLKAGFYYVSLDILYPVERLQYVLADSQAQIVLTDDAHLELAQSLAGPEQLILNIDHAGEGESEENLDLPISPDTMSHLVYTSGSTGQPKGVVHVQRTILFGMWHIINNNHMYEGDRIPLVTPLNYGSSLINIYGSLFCGATIFMTDINKRSVESLTDWLYANEITIMKLATPIVQQVMHVVEQNRDRYPEFPSLRLAFTGGQIIAPYIAERFLALYGPGALFRTGGGTSETTWIAECYMDEDSDLGDYPIPFGYVVPDKEVLLWDVDGQPVAEGEIGEIVIKTRYQALGYWNLPELSAEKFLPDPDGGPDRLYRTGDLGQFLPGGLLYLLGRKDKQVKVLGHRVEIGEVESALMALSDIKTAVVVGRPDPTGSTRLIAYLVAAEGRTPRRGDVLTALADTLPDYMIPSRVMFLDAIPLIANTKIDWNNLPEPSRERPDLDTPYAAPRTEVEKQVAEIWAEALDLETVGIHDTFLELGGHSLLATHLIARVSDRFGLAVTHETLFDAPTVAEMAMILGPLLEMDGTARQSSINTLPRQSRQMQRSDSGMLSEEGD